jgi:hypothetical protein
MALWLTLLLIWTTGIPAVLFLVALLGTVISERRAARLPALAIRSPARRPALTPCSRRLHASGRLWPSRAHQLRTHAGSRRPV